MFSKKSVRCHVFIDGYNVYVPLHKHYLATGENYKWVNYRRVIQKLWVTNTFLNQFSLSELSVSLFTAKPYWNKEKQQRHEVFLEACQSEAIQIVLGRHNSKHEEKESDVACAIEFYRKASSYDIGILMTADTDFVPAVKAILQDFPDKCLVLITPPKAQKCKALTDQFPDNQVIHSKIGIYKDSQFPITLALPNGKQLQSPYSS